MANEQQPVTVGEVISGSLFSEPMRVVTVTPVNSETWELGLVGVETQVFRSVPLGLAEIRTLKVQNAARSYAGDCDLLRLGLQAYALGIAYEFDPYFGLSISRVDPLPHQLEAVYDYLLKLARVRFLLADDAGAGKTIMAGLLLRELRLRGLVQRVLIVCPANLAFQWQRELREKFDEQFVVLKGDAIREQYGINQWLDNRQVITSLDLAKRENILPGLRQVHWDMVIVDEAHRMSWSPPARKTARYALGELLRDRSDHLLMLTATPHKGDPEHFSRFLQLLDPDAYADVKSIRQAIEQRSAPFYLRRTKEAMVYFPTRQPDGSWVAKKLFTKRDTRTADFTIDNDELRLYRDVTGFVKEQSRKAAAHGDDPRARAVGFLMALYQRRLASSARALRRSLENRAARLTENLKRAQELALTAPRDLPTEEELEEMEETERERFERLLEAVTIAQNPAQVREEVVRLEQFAERAKALGEAEAEAKLAKLHTVLREQGFFDKPDERLLIFTEFKDTLDYLVENFGKWGFRVGFIHGGMSIGSRDERGSRLYVEQQFREGAIQILVATEAAGEGINLQCCHILFNYDIPWNPNRLEQRMGRIHRYGQLHDCLIFNFVATNTVEGRILDKLLERLNEIRKALDDDAVFNVVGEVLPAAHIERVLREYYAGNMGDADLEDRLLGPVSEERFRAICQNALEGLASKKLNLQMLVERRARAQEKRLVPETIARFIAQAAPYSSLTLKPVATLPHSFDPGTTPQALRRYESSADWRLQRLASRYPRLSTDREVADKNSLHPESQALPRAPVIATDRHRRPDCTPRSRSARQSQASSYCPILNANSPILFESSGGQSDQIAHQPELRFALCDPEVDTTSIDNAAMALEGRAFYIRKAGTDGYRFGLKPKLEKVVYDRRASLDDSEVRKATERLVETQFRTGSALNVQKPFPRESADIEDIPQLNLVIVDPDETWAEAGDLRSKLAEWTRMRGKSRRLYPASLVWCVRKPGRELRDRVEDWLAWQRVQREISDGTLGREFETGELREVAAKVKGAEDEAREEVWASFRFIAFADPKAAEGLGETDLGAGHSSGAKSLADRVLGALRSNALLNESPGAGYLERRWPEAFKASGAWPLKSLRQAFLDGSLDRVINPDEYLKRKVPELVAKGDFGLASGDLPGGGFERVWFREPISPDEVSFDAGVYLLRRERAEAGRAGSAKPFAPESESAEGSTTEGGGTETTSGAGTDHEVGTAGKVHTLTLTGAIPPELWNKVGIRIIPKLRSAQTEPHLGVSFTLEINGDQAAHLLRELQQAVSDLGLVDQITLKIN